MKDILREADTSGPAARPPESEFQQVPLSRRLSVGARLDGVKARAIEAAVKLTGHADKETALVIASVAEQLRKQACRIAFVGQVKAGKSSLVNALIEQPDLLPVDINPCTAVITRLNFGAPDKPAAGAAFTFFSRDEWLRLSHGGRTRELTDRLFPDFNWETLNTQVKEMEVRARMRLGASFEDLLGTEHVYADVEPGLLVRYIGAEFSQTETAAERGGGEFSDITKSADIFLDLGAFSFPTVVIDTPGVNDPFLVRDEITRQNLEAADICIVVITAWQRLSATDINLLRMLRGLKKDRLIVFVNKVDELKGGEAVTQEVGRRVAQTLEDEFPATSIPVILGSAAFAHKALDRGTSGYFPNSAGADRDDDESGFSAEELSSAGFDWLIQDESSSESTAETYFEKSGLVSLAVAVSEMMSAGQIAETIGNASRLIESVGANLIAWRTIEAGLLEQASSGAAQARNELAAIAGLRKRLAAKFEVFSESLDELRARKVDSVQQKLSLAVQAFIPQALAPFSSGHPAAQASQIDVKLRMRLELAFLEAMEDIRNSLENEQELLRLELSKVLGASGIGGPKIVLGQTHALTPSMTALSEPAALGFTAHLAGQPGGLATGQDRGAKLPDLITADFAPIIDKLAGEASRVFRQEAATFAAQTKALTLGPIDSMIERVSLALELAQAPAREDSERVIQAVREAISILKPIAEGNMGMHPAHAGALCM